MWTNLSVDLVPLRLKDSVVYVHAGFLAAALETFPEVSTIVCVALSREDVWLN